MSTGLDWAWGRPSEASLDAAGATFACRYLCSDQYASKRITRAEAAWHLAAGRGVVLVWEDSAGSIRRGRAGGVADATAADAQCTAFGLAGCPVYFACDYDAPASDQPLIDAYLDGAASVIGRARTGLYGGYWPLSRARAAGKAAYWWGTVAWSSTNWATCGWKPHIMQGSTVFVGGVSCDRDTANSADFGQYKAPAPPPVPPPAPSWTEILVNSLPTLVLNASGEDVKSAQGLLAARGYPVAMDGAFGPATRAAVVAFQAASGLTADGSAGPLTWAKLLHR